MNKRFMKYITYLLRIVQCQPVSGLDYDMIYGQICNRFALIQSVHFFSYHSVNLITTFTDS